METQLRDMFAYVRRWMVQVGSKGSSQRTTPNNQQSMAQLCNNATTVRIVIPRLVRMARLVACTPSGDQLHILRAVLS